MLMKKFKYLEVVKVGSDEITRREGISGLCGYIQTDGSFYEGEYIWGVYINRKEGVYMLRDSQLTSMGKVLKKEDIYDGTTVRVKVNPKTGEGEALD